MKKKNEKKNIVLFANTLWFFEKFKYELIINLQEKYNVYCLYLKKGPPIDKKRVDTLKDKGVNFQILTFYLTIKLLTRISFNLGLKYEPTLKPDKVLVFTLSPILLSSIVFVKYRSQTSYVLEGLGRVFVSRKLIYRVLRRIVAAIYKFLFLNCFSVIALNYSDATYLAEMSIAPLCKIKVIPGTGLDIQKVNQFSNSNKKNPIYIDFMARLIAEKGIYKFVYIRLNLLKYYPKIAEIYKFRIITPSSDIESISSDDLNYLKSLGIILKPYLESPYKYYSESKALVVPTTYGEGLSRVALEAAYLGIPLLVNRNRGTEDFLPINYKYFMVSDNPTSISSQLVQLLDDEDYFNQIKTELRLIIEKKFTTEHSINSFLFAIENKDNF